MNREMLEKYAEVALRIGINLQEKENLIMNVSHDAMDLGIILQRKAYEMGAKDVIIHYSNDELTLNRFLYGKDYVFEQVSPMAYKLGELGLDEKYHRMHVLSSDPTLLKDVDKERLGKWTKVYGQAMMPLMRRMMANEVKWTIVETPNPVWAKSVFPDDDEDVALEKLWKAIFSVTRVDRDDPIQAWHDHDKELDRLQNFLNEAKFEKLLYKGPGTDLEVGLAEGNVWLGGSNKSMDGDIFFPNIPTEEVFGMPHAYKVNGTLSATMPLFYMGNLIDGMKFTFVDGKVTEYSAEEGLEVLDNLMNLDEGARRLGEVAIVQDDSPISNTGILFKSTLFDENASCHFAFGKAYADNNSHKNVDSETMKKIGMNDSITHVDFMVGGPELSIVGVKADGEKVTLLEKGNWVI